MAGEMNYQAIGEQFAQFYFSKFEASRDAVGVLYHPDAMLTFEGAQIQGPAAIVEKFKSLSFQVVQHSVTKVDCQPTRDSGILVLVTGQLKTDDDHPQSFSRIFYLVQNANNLAVQHDIFRLSLHNA